MNSLPNGQNDESESGGCGCLYILAEAGYLYLRERFRFCPRCSGFRALIPMREMDEGTILNRDTKFGIPSLCMGTFECRCCGNRQQFAQGRYPPAVRRRLREMDPNEEYYEWLTRESRLKKAKLETELAARKAEFMQAHGELTGVPRRNEAKFSDNNDHNPLVLEDCRACSGSGATSEKVCPECNGSGLTGHVIRYFENDNPIASVRVNKHGWVQCPCCGLRFLTSEADAFSARRCGRCGQRIRITG
jgi:hypothetical protein